MHYDIRDIKVNNGLVLLAMKSGKRGFIPTTIEGFEAKCPYEQMREVGRMLFSGELQFTKPAKCRAKGVYEHCKSRFGTNRNRGRNAKVNRERFANEFARRMCA